MTNLIIIGSGAHASEIVDYINDYNKFSTQNNYFFIKGFIDYEYNIENYHDHYDLEMPVLGDIDNYQPVKDDRFIIGIADVPFRKIVIKKAQEKKWVFTNFIHHSCIISKNIEIGFGNVIAPYCIIGSRAKLGNYNFLNCHATISHDCVVGENNIISSFSGLAGHVKVQDNNFLALHSSILPKLTVGSNNVVQAGMVVDRSVNDDEVIFHRFREKIIAIPKIIQDQTVNE